MGIPGCHTEIRKCAAASNDDEGKDSEREIPVQPVFTFSNCIAHGATCMIKLLRCETVWGNAEMNNVTSAFFRLCLMNCTVT